MVITRTLKTGVVTRDILISSLCHLVICFRFLFVCFSSVFSLFVRFLFLFVLFCCCCFGGGLGGGGGGWCRGGAGVLFLSFSPDNT